MAFQCHLLPRFLFLAFLTTISPLVFIHHTEAELLALFLCGHVRFCACGFAVNCHSPINHPFLHLTSLYVHVRNNCTFFHRVSGCAVFADASRERRRTFRGYVGSQVSATCSWNSKRCFSVASPIPHPSVVWDAGFGAKFGGRLSLYRVYLLRR